MSNLVTKEWKWDELVAQVRSHVDRIERKSEDLANERWELGKIVWSWQSRQDSRSDYYGKDVVGKLAEEANMHPTTLYQSIALAKAFPTKVHFDKFIKKIKGAGFRVTWEIVRRRALPEPSKDASQYGGKEQQTQIITSSAEKSSENLVELVKTSHDTETRIQVAGTLIKIQEDVFEAAKIMKEPLPDVQIFTETPTEVPTVWPPSLLANYHNFVRMQPCAACGREATDTNKSELCHFPLTVGVGDDRWVVALCLECHRSQHSIGIDTFFEQWKHKIILWWHNWALRFFWEVHVLGVTVGNKERVGRTNNKTEQEEQ